MERDGVALGQQGLQRDGRRRRARRSPRRGRSGRYARSAAAEAAEPVGDGAADPAEADDPDGHVAQGLHPIERDGQAPAAVADEPAVGGDPPGRVEQEGERVVGHLVDAVGRDVADGDAAGPGRVEVHVVDADPVADDQPGPVHRGDHPRGDRGELGQDVVGLGDGVEEVGLGPALAGVDLGAEGPEDRLLDVEPVEREIGDEDLRHRRWFSREGPAIAAGGPVYEPRRNKGRRPSRANRPPPRRDLSRSRERAAGGRGVRAGSAYRFARPPFSRWERPPEPGPSGDAQGRTTTRRRRSSRPGRACRPGRRSRPASSRRSGASRAGPRCWRRC